MKSTALQHYDISLLYVEDEQVTREQISRILKKIVTELHVAENGQHGLELYLEKQPDIVLTDIMMPLMNGLDMAREIRKLDRERQIIMLTAYSDTDYLLECIRLGVNQYVQKPVDFDRLSSAIEICSNYILLKRRLEQQETRIHMLSQAVEQAPAPVVITTVDGIIEYVNQMFTRLTGYHASEVIGKKPSILKSGLNPETLYKELWTTISAGSEWKGEMANRRKDGEIYWEVVKICPLRDATNNITGYLKVSQDITERKKYEEDLRYLGTHDPLTGVFNRTYFDAELQRLEAGREFPLSIVMVDIDGLKQVNDHQGHAAGDVLIKGAANVLISAFRSSDVVARIGGDEFAVLLPRTDHETVMTALSRLRAVEDDPTLGSHARSLSIGVATAQTAEETAEAVKQADILMYRNKTERRHLRQPLTPDVTGHR